MAKKRRKYIKPTPPRKNVSRTDSDRCYHVAKKLLRHFELEPELIDVFSKKQKQKLLKNYFEPSIVKPDKPKTVPRQHVKSIHNDMYQFMKTNFFGNPENNLTYMELTVYGFSFIVNLSNMHVRDAAFIPGSPQEEAARRICEKFNNNKEKFIYEIAFKDISHQIWYLTRSYSRVNFRIYGFIIDCDHIPQSCGCCTNMKITIRLTAQECEAKRFIYNNIERKAFRALIPDGGVYSSAYATVRRNQIFPKSKKDDLLNIYIQSHVLHRFKERLDVFDPYTQNLLIQYSFAGGLGLVSSGKQVLFSCPIDDDKPVGYFTFFVQENDVVINTFLPLTSVDTPEGKKLHELLSLSKEEIIYLGMDKLSFLLDVDFEQVPILKQALIDANIWETKVILDSKVIHDEEKEDENKIKIQNKTVFIKTFFDKL